MMTYQQEPFSAAGGDCGEETLRLIATLQVPEGLVDRVQESLHAAPRTATLIPWPAAFHPHGGFMRGAAAAAIVCLVAGGGWRIYSHVPASPRVLEMAHPSAVSTPFGSAGAKHVPETLNGPVLIQHPMGTSQAEPVKATVGAKPVVPQSLRSRKKAAHSAIAAPVH